MVRQLISRKLGFLVLDKSGVRRGLSIIEMYCLFICDMDTLESLKVILLVNAPRSLAHSFPRS